MNACNVQLGMKVVPFAKSMGAGDFSEYRDAPCATSRFFREKGYLVVNRKFGDNAFFLGLPGEKHGDLFMATDFNLYRG